MAGLMSGFAQDDVDNFMAFTNTFDNPEIAKDYLMNNHNDVSKAIDEWFRLLDPNYYKNRMVKYGPQNQMQEVNPWSNLAGGSASHGLAQPTTASNENKSHPPSRPPSRAHATTEWEAWNETDPMATGVTNNEDALVQEALELSRLDQGPTSSVAPKILDPEPKARIRKPGQPAFLKPLPNGDFLPALITILQSVPKIRNELLSKDDFLQDYRWNEHWWEGERIEIPRIMPSNQDDHGSTLDIIHEAQRLVAFLENTTRAYGNLEPLLKILASSALANSSDQESIILRFLKQWDAATQSHEANTHRFWGPVESLFKSNVTTPTTEPSTSLQNTAWRISASAFDLPTGTNGSLYDVLDNAILGPLNEERALFHQEFAPILIILLDSSSNSKSISVPGELFVDRYLEQNWDFIKSSRAMAQQEISENEALIDKIARLETFQSPQASQRGDALKLMSAALTHLQYRQSQSIPEVSIDGPNGIDNEGHELESTHSRVLQQLAEIDAKLQARLKVLNQEKQSRAERISAYSKIGTMPDEPQFPAQERYFLQGVATNHHQQPSIYAMHSSQIEDTGADNESLHVSQWWKMIYDTRFTASVRNEKVTSDQVFGAAGEMASNTLLVYVQEEYLNPMEEDVQIPHQLMDFVERDNASFYAETDDPFSQNPVIEIEGVPVGDGKGFDYSRSDSETLNLETGGPGPSIEMDERNGHVVDPTGVEGNDLSSKLQEIEEAGAAGGAFSPKKRKKSGGGDGADSSSDLETMAPDSDVDLS